MVVVVALSLSPQGYLHRKRDSLCYGGGDGGGGRSFLPLSPLSGGDGGGGRSFSLFLFLHKAISSGREILCVWW